MCWWEPFLLLRRLTVPTCSHRDRMKSALQTYSSLPAHYSPHRWTSLESYVLSKAIDIYSLSGIDKDKQWITIALSCLKSYSGGGGSEGESLIPHADSATYITNLVGSLKTVVDKLSERSSSCSPGLIHFLTRSADSAFTYSEHPALTIRLLDTTAEPAEDDDGSFIHVSVLNLLPCVSPRFTLGGLLFDGSHKGTSCKRNLFEPVWSRFRKASI